MKAFVLGGTGFIGRRLVRDLQRHGWEVTIAATGRTPNPYGDGVRYTRVDRADPTALRAAVESLGTIDVLFDQICFDPKDAEQVIGLFSGRVRRYVFVSSGAVYSGGRTPYRESDLDPFGYVPQVGTMDTLGYGEGKRSAEAWLFQKAPFPVAAARFPNVLGHDDSTRRFQQHAEWVLRGERIVIPPGAGRSTYVWVEDAGRFLSWLGREAKSGPYNAATFTVLDARDLVERMGRTLGRTPQVVTDGGPSERSAYYRSTSLLSVEKAESEGFRFTPLDGWFELEVARWREDHSASAPRA